MTFFNQRNIMSREGKKEANDIINPSESSSTKASDTDSLSDSTVKLEPTLNSD